MPALPGGRLGEPYPSLTLTASGGTAPHAFSISAGQLPAGLVLAADGVLSGTPCEAGDFTATVTATDGLGFTGTASPALTVRATAVPVAQDLTLEVMAGTSGSLDLTRGATNGPFTGAEIAAHPLPEAGSAAIRRDGAAYLLDFAAAGDFAGSPRLRYTLSTTSGRSARQR